MPSGNDDRTTEYSYDAADRVQTLTAWQSGGSTSQKTQWAYGVTNPTDGSGSALYSNDLVGEVRYPDKTSSEPSAAATDIETYQYNALGQLTSCADRNGSAHRYDYDVLGRLTADKVMTLGGPVNGVVRRRDTAYDTAGRPFRLTSHSTHDLGVGNVVVNQGERVYNGLSQLVTEYQSHAGAVDPATTVRVRYTYSALAGGANHSRLTGLIYPDTQAVPTGRVLTYDYGNGLNDTISRLDELSSAGTVLERYTYLGLTTVVERLHPQPGVDLTYLAQTGMDASAPNVV